MTFRLISPGLSGEAFFPYEPVLSADGRYVLFSSNSSSLSPEDSDTNPDIFVFDTLTNQVDCVSKDVNYPAGTGFTYATSISADGRFVAFIGAPALEEGSAYVYDRQLGVTTNITLGSEPVAVTPPTKPGKKGKPDKPAKNKEKVKNKKKKDDADDAPPQTPDLKDTKFSAAVISDDGKKVLLVTDPKDLNAEPELFIYDIATKSSKLIGPGSNPAASNDGSYTVFSAPFADANGSVSTQIILSNNITGAYELISRNESGDVANTSSTGASVSADGRFVAFFSRATNLDGDKKTGAYLHDRNTGETKQIFTSEFRETYKQIFDTDLQNGNFSISGDGRFILGGGIIYDTLTGRLARVLDSDGMPVGAASMSQDGKHILVSTWTRLSDQDVNDTQDLYLTLNPLLETPIAGTDVSDVLVGGTGQDILEGFDGNDVLDGGLNCDILEGGKGDDVYVVDIRADTVTERAGEGVDRVVSSVLGSYEMPLHVENVTLVNGATVAEGNALDNVMIGNELRNSLYGGEGNDYIDGGAGTDDMYGGAGDDTFVVDNVRDYVAEFEGEGFDTILSSVTIQSSIEKIQLVGTSDINASGSVTDQIIIGNDGNNVLSGQGGNDRLVGGKGDDTYILNSYSVTEVTENENEGNDTIVSDYEDVILQEHVENVTVSIFVEAVGNSLNNIMRGGKNLSGLAGDDTLIANSNTTLTGGSGSDAFVFGSYGNLFNSGAVITDFVIGEDKIHLDRTQFADFQPGELDASMFVTGAAALTPDQKIIYDRENGVLYYDRDGAGEIQLNTFARLTPGLDLSEDDFYIV
ncbi:MAG: hypothetical protein NW215_10270 [Hyphomicrobiales bacterium]|nr:hypothetical protein [Hyphomicrobiales bacterium]